MPKPGSFPELRKTEALNHPYSICGRRCYLVGFQNGLFPDLGWHKSNEMGGIWTHPIKIADGFWISVDAREEGKSSYNPIRREWLTKSHEFVMGDGNAWVEHRYSNRRFDVVRREFVPREEPALGVEVRVTPRDKSIKTARLSVLVRFDILPAWQAGWPDPLYLEADTFDNTVVVHASSSYDIPYEFGYWTAALRSDPDPDRIATGESLWGPERTQGNGLSCLLKYNLTFDPSDSVRFVMSGSIEGEKPAVDTVNRVLENYDAMAQEKVDWYHHIGSELTTVETPEASLNDAFLWSKMNLEWLTQASPCIGTSVVAGYQDYSSYFGGDTETSIHGILAAGLHQTAKDSLRALGAQAMKLGGKVPHEYSSSGNVHDPGGAGETALFADCVWQTYLWTGDEEFLREMYPICHKGMVEFLSSEPTEDGLLLLEYEDRPGGARHKGLPCGLSHGCTSFANIAERLGDADTARSARANAEHYRQQMEELFWVEEYGMYASHLDGDNKPVINREDDNWSSMKVNFLSVGCTGIADRDRMIRAFDQLDDPKFSTEYGVMLHITQDEIMPCTTGWVARAEFNYGRLEQGMEYLRMTARTLGNCMPGAMPEVLDPHGDISLFRHFESPHWNYLQLWSAALFTEGMIWGVLRIEPDAARGTVTMTPRLPKGWPSAEFKNITIGSSRMNVRVDTKGTKVTHVDGPELEIAIKSI